MIESLKKTKLLWIILLALGAFIFLIQIVLKDYVGSVYTSIGVCIGICSYCIIKNIVDSNTIFLEKNYKFITAIQIFMAILVLLKYILGNMYQQVIQADITYVFIGLGYVITVLDKMYKKGVTMQKVEDEML